MSKICSPALAVFSAAGSGPTTRSPRDPESIIASSGGAFGPSAGASVWGTWAVDGVLRRFGSLLALAIPSTLIAGPAGPSDSPRGSTCPARRGGRTVRPRRQPRRDHLAGDGHDEPAVAVGVGQAAIFTRILPRRTCGCVSAHEYPPVLGIEHRDARRRRIRDPPAPRRRTHPRGRHGGGG